MTAGSALIDTSTLGAFLLAAARAIGLALTAPVIGDGTTPVRARLVFVLATAAAVAPVIPATPLADVVMPLKYMAPFSPGELPVTCTREPIWPKTPVT